MPRLKANDERLSGAELQQFHAALLDAFDLPSLTALLRFRLNRRLDDLSLANDRPTIVLDVLSKAEDSNWTADLLAAARATRPDNAGLLALGQLYGLSTSTPPRRELELRIREANGFIDVVQWREGLGRAENWVCRVERTEPDGSVRGIGTAFLLGPDLAITNYHVLEPLYTGQASPEKIGFRFDYKVLSGGVVINPGRVYRLAAADWDVDHSPYSALDKEVDPPQAPAPEELDYAVVRLSGSAGQDAVSGGHGDEPGAPRRGWVPLPEGEHDFAKDKALFILQHPDGMPLKLAIDTQAVVGTVGRDGVQTRVRYTTNTEPGSSGSPCFDAGWKLVALHHSGDPTYYAFGTAARYNQGIPVTSIRALLTERGKVGLLGAQEL